MPPTLVSAVDSQKTWLRSPLISFHQNFIPRRCPTNDIAVVTASPQLSIPNQHQQPPMSTFNDNWNPRNSITCDYTRTSIYSKLATDKEGVPLICTKSYLTLPEKQQIRTAQDHRNCWPIKNYRNDISSSWARNREHDVVSSSSASSLPTAISVSTTTRTNLTMSEECYMNSENCLPRIIKPRKRRKKDRKPSAAAMLTNSSTAVSTSPILPVNQLSQLNTNLKSSTDSCITAAPAASVSGSYGVSYHPCENKLEPLLSSPKNVLLGMRIALCRPNVGQPESASDRTNVDVPCNSSLISRSLVNILTENDDDEQNTLSVEEFGDELSTKDAAGLSVEGTTSVCRCKYCDPESVVWDVSQRCFSPNLMPPVSKAITSQQSFSPPMSSSFPKSSYTTLKRSSSEPTSKPSVNPVVARVRSFSSGSCDKFSKNLLVSSQIVTSHDGHRDIEVKFFSLLTSPSSSIVPE